MTDPEVNRLTYDAAKKIARLDAIIAGLTAPPMAANHANERREEIADLIRSKLPNLFMFGTDANLLDAIATAERIVETRRGTGRCAAFWAEVGRALVDFVGDESQVQREDDVFGFSAEVKAQMGRSE